MNGFVNIYKGKGMTSHDVVSRLRRILKTKKIGHGGTLDPNAEGILIMGVGTGTRLLEYVAQGTKGYEGELVLGAVSDTEDIVGNVEKVSYEKPELKAVKMVIEQLDGQELEQVPPMYSSVKVGGKKLYEYAREGKTIAREARKIVIHELKLLGDLYEKEGFLRIGFYARVSKGTYIRSLCVTIGEMLGIPCIMGDLLRVSSGNFQLKDSFSLELVEELVEKEDPSFLLPLKQGFLEETYYYLKEEAYRDLSHGKMVPASEVREEGSLIPCLYEGELVTLARFREGYLKVEKNIGGQQ